MTWRNISGAVAHTQHEIISVINIQHSRENVVFIQTYLSAA